MKNKFFYIGLSLILPGMGQITAKRYVRGILQAFGAVAAILWLAAEVILPLVKFYSGDILNNELPEINFISLLMPIILFFAILAWSIIDLMFGFNKPNNTNIIMNPQNP
jgi:TM2 domain-containing membrane protein YozV